MTELNIEYQGARIRVQIEADHEADSASQACPNARLYINSLLRDQVKLRPGNHSIRLSTSLQTDYEWHEHVEAVITVNNKQMTVSLLANQQELASQSYSL